MALGPATEHDARRPRTKPAAAGRFGAASGHLLCRHAEAPGDATCVARPHSSSSSCTASASSNSSSSSSSTPSSPCGIGGGSALASALQAGTTRVLTVMGLSGAALTLIAGLPLATRKGAAAFAAERETFAVALGEKTGVQHVARAASSMIRRLAPAWGRVRRTDPESASRLAALCALAAAVCSIDATHLREALASLVQACPGQATPPRTPVKAPRPLSPLGLGPPETPVTPLSPHAAEPIDDWDDWDDDEVEEPVVASSAGLAVLVDAVRAELGAEASAPRLSFF